MPGASRNDAESKALEAQRSCYECRGQAGKTAKTKDPRPKGLATNAGGKPGRHRKPRTLDPRVLPQMPGASRDDAKNKTPEAQRLAMSTARTPRRRQRSNTRCPEAGHKHRARAPGEDAKNQTLEAQRLATNPPNAPQKSNTGGPEAGHKPAQRPRKIEH